VVAGLAVVGTLALGGCAGSPQAAAYVGNTQISQAGVDAVSKAIVEAGAAETTSVARNVVVQIKIQNEIAKQAAARANITVTDAQRQQLLAQNTALDPLLKNPETRDFTIDYVNTAVILNSDAGKKAATEVIGDTSVRVNPRYGTWDPQQLALAEGSSGSLSELAPARQE
jgi:hypothetical protein